MTARTRDRLILVLATVGVVNGLIGLARWLG